MSAEAGRAPEPLQLGHRAKDRLVVGRRLVKPRPGGLDPGRGERRRPPCGLFEHLLEELPVHVGHITRRLSPIAHTDQDPVALWVKVERRLKVHGHRRVASNRWKWAGYS